MKLKKIISLIFVSSLLSIPSLCSYGASASLDTVSSEQISGWALNDSETGEPAVVKIDITNLASGICIDEITAIATGHRSDLTSMGDGSGNFKFSILPDWEYYGNGSYKVDAYVDDTLIGSKTYHTDSNSSENQTTSMGIFKTTAYCPCTSCSEGWGRRTSTGAVATSSHTIAVDPHVIPYGSKVMINGVIYTAEDRGGGVKGNHIDIFFDTHTETYMHGVQYQEVFLVNE